MSSFPHQHIDRPGYLLGSLHQFKSLIPSRPNEIVRFEDSKWRLCRHRCNTDGARDSQVPVDCKTCINWPVALYMCRPRCTCRVFCGLPCSVVTFCMAGPVADQDRSRPTSGSNRKGACPGGGGGLLQAESAQDLETHATEFQQLLLREKKKPRLAL